VTRLIIYTVTLSMIFHQTVSASFNVTPSPFNCFASPAVTFSNASARPKIISFNSNSNKGKIILTWSITDNQDVDRFEVERSLDGKIFETAGLVFANYKSGTDSYQFFEKENKTKTYYYRIRIVAKNDSVDYSQAIMAGPDIIK
jgi:hypothetical protein